MTHKTVVFTEGRFGAAVGLALTARFDDTIIRPLGESVGDLAALDKLLEGASFVAAALWRPYPAACEVLDRACARAGIRWAPAVLDRKRIWIGPIIEVPAGPCFRCYRRRYMTHLALPERELVLESAYERGPGRGIPGFCEPLVAMTASGLVAAASAPIAALGSYRRIDTVDASVETSRVVRVHGCDRCGPSRVGDPLDRYVRNLQPLLPESFR